MKNIYKLFTVAALSGTFMLTSCIEEPIPTNTVIDEVLQSSSKASESLVWAMPAFLNKYGVYDSDRHYDWGYGSLMHIRDVMTADMAVVSSGYNWYSSWSGNNYQGRRYVYSAFTWYYYFGAINTANNAIGALKGVTEGLSAGYLGAAYAYRALFYLDAARIYEFLPNDQFGLDYVTTNADGGSDDDSTFGKSINYLTVPIVTDETPEDQVQNNPRVSHEAMYDFILSDLTMADSLISNYARTSKTTPDKACVYGLMSRLYMWNAGYLEETGKTAEALAEYAKAEKAAADAIAENVNQPLTRTQWLDTKTGFNDMSVSSWMWASSASADDDVVQSGILNWTSWMSNEATFGYAAAGPFTMIASELYDKISNNDFRKLSFKAPEDHDLSGKEPLLITAKNDENYMYGDFPTYTSMKFRPGAGIPDDSKEGAACDYPIMRIEEMYLTQAEAAAHQDAARGAQLLTDFVRTYRDPSYECAAVSTTGVVDACFLQKRIELWGEGQTFFDYKRLNKSVDRTQSKNWDATENFKTNGRPAWMNFTIIISEENNNQGLKGYNNPDPSGLYTPVQ